MSARAIGQLGSAAVASVAWAGQLALVLARAVRPLWRLDRRELVRALVEFGFESLPLTAAVSMLAGATVVVQTSLYVERFNARGFLGWAAGYAILWEFGPLLIGLLMAARIGARNAAELASLTVGGQLEGLEGISLDPYQLLIGPRVIGIVVSITGLSAVGFVIAVGCEALAAYATLGLPFRAFLLTFADMLSWADVVGGLAKAATFGGAIALLSTAAGLSARGGAQAVGSAAASAVVRCSAAIFALDFLVTPPLAQVLG